MKILSHNGNPIVGNGKAYVPPPGSGTVESVNGKTGSVVLSASDINTEDSQSIQASLDRIDRELDNTKTLGFQGKVISILGDSISTFDGYVPISDGHNLTHRIRYNRANAPWFFNEGGTVDDTYWKHLINTLGAKLGVNDSWAGSRVSNSSASDSGDVGPKACMAGMTRIENLGANGTPDLILYFGGTNDAGANVTVGSFDSTQTYTLNTTSTTWSDFASAFKDSIMRLQYLYPYAKIIVLLPMYCATYYTMGNLDKYNEQIKLICDYFGVEYIDFRRCGINQQNLSTMLGDGIHPKKAGFELMYRYLYNKLSSMYSSDNIENVVYTVTNNLTTNTNADRYIKGVSSGHSYKATITGSNLSLVHVTMGGVDVTSTVYNSSTGKISITNVTGNIIIGEGSVVTHTVTTNVTNGSYTGATSIIEGATAAVTISANNGYRLPSSITVTGAAHTYDSSTGVITLSNATADVTISAICELIPVYNISTDVTNGTYTGDTSISENGTAAVTISAGIGYTLPDSIVVSGATYTYSQETGVIELSNPTGNVSITVVCEAHAATVYDITTAVTGGTYSGATQIQEGSTAAVTVVANGSYVLPETITVTGATYTWDRETGIISLSNPTSNVTISVECVEIVTHTITTNVTNGTSSGDTDITNIGTATVILSADSGYELPDNITVIGADYTYVKETGVVTLTNATSNVVITAVCVVGETYTEVEYLYAEQNVGGSGASKQWLITDIPYEDGDIVEIDAQADGSSQVMVVSNTGNGSGGSWLGYNGGKWAVGGAGYQSSIPGTSRINAIITYADSGVTAVVSDGTTTDTITRPLAGTGTQNVHSFFTMHAAAKGGLDYVTYGFKGKIFSAKIKRNGEYIANFVPAIRNSDNAVGFLEKISGRFMYSDDSPMLTAGQPVNNN